MPALYDDSWLLDTLAADARLNLSLPITDGCAGCGASLLTESIGPHGFPIRDYACGHRYTLFSRTTHIGKTPSSIKNQGREELPT